VAVASGPGVLVLSPERLRSLFVAITGPPCPPPASRGAVCQAPAGPAGRRRGGSSTPRRSMQTSGLLKGESSVRTGKEISRDGHSLCSSTDEDARCSAVPDVHGDASPPKVRSAASLRVLTRLARGPLGAGDQRTGNSVAIICAHPRPGAHGPGGHAPRANLAFTPDSRTPNARGKPMRRLSHLASKRCAPR